MVDADTIKVIKQSLLEERARLESLVSRTAKHLYRREEPYSADFAEQAVETQNNEVVEQLDRDSQLELKLVDKALERIEQGNYGVCTECGSAINPRRLQAVPVAEHCIDCASA